ncbi:MAG: DUF5856 family protein [Rikenellaceae bacterium]|nr:DUF5856 family protein [Rikenellaceae bacterium]
MATATETKKTTEDTTQMGDFFGRLYSFNASLKLYHWHVTGTGSYAEHIALDQAIESITDTLDRIVETSYSLYGDIDITIPETPVPQNIEEHCQKYYDYIQQSKEMFKEDFSESILDDFMEAIQQLLFRLRRLR